MAPESFRPGPLAPTEAALVDRLLTEVASRYSVDPTRIVVHGYEGGGSLAFLAAQRNPDMIRAVAAVEASPAGTLPESDPVHRLAVYMAWSDKSSSARPIEAPLPRCVG